MTALPATPTHTVIVMEMLSVATRVGTPWVHIDDIAHRLYPNGRPVSYVESIRSTIHRLRKLLKETDGGISCDGSRYAPALDLPGVFRPGAGFVRRPAPKVRVSAALPKRFVAGVQPRASR